MEDVPVPIHVRLYQVLHYLKRLFISAKQVALLEQKEEIALEFEPGVGEIAARERVLQGVGTTQLPVRVQPLLELFRHYLYFNLAYSLYEQ